MMSIEAVTELANDGRLQQLAQTALRRAAMPFRATLFAKSGDANWLIPWHQDTALPLTGTFDDPEWGSWSQKAGICYAHAPGVLTDPEVSDYDNRHDHTTCLVPRDVVDSFFF